jgi:hypothetical protein
MTTPLHTTTIRRLGALLAVATALAALSAAPALGKDRPLSSYYKPQDLQRMSDSWAAKGGYLRNVPTSSYYTPQQIQMMSQSWAARAALSSLATAQAALGSLPSETRSALLSRVEQTPTVVSSHSSFERGDFGIGAAAMLGLMLLAGGLLAGAHYGRRSVRARPAA